MFQFLVSQFIYIFGLSDSGKVVFADFAFVTWPLVACLTTLVCFETVILMYAITMSLISKLKYNISCIPVYSI